MVCWNTVCSIKVGGGIVDLLLSRMRRGGMHASTNIRAQVFALEGWKGCFAGTHQKEVCDEFEDTCLGVLDGYNICMMVHRSNKRRFHKWHDCCLSVLREDTCEDASRYFVECGQGGFYCRDWRLARKDSQREDSS